MFCLPKLAGRGRPPGPNRFAGARVALDLPSPAADAPIRRPRGPTAVFRYAKCTGSCAMTRDTARRRRMLYRRHAHRLWRPCAVSPSSIRTRREGLARRLSDPRAKAGISVCSLSSIRSRCRERPCDCRPAARGRPRHPRNPSLSERAGAPERLAAVGHPAALARDARGRSSGSTASSIDSVGVDTWGCDYALLGEHGNLLQNPYHYRDARTDGVMDAVFERVPADEIYAITGIQFLPFNTLYQLYAACQATPKLIDAASTMLTIPDLLNYWLTGIAGRRVHQRDDHPVRGRADAVLGDRAALGARHSDAAAPAARRSRAPCSGGCARTSAARWPARRWWRRRATTPGRRSRRSPAAPHRAFLSSGTWSLLGTEVRGADHHASARAS